MDPAYIEKVQRKLQTSHLIYEKYKWLLNCYVLDFFTENHWLKLEESWQQNLNELCPSEIAVLLDYNANMGGKLWPLSILTLKNLLSNLSLPRRKVELYTKTPFFMQDHKLMQMFWKNVKAKKRHEISIISKLCYKSAVDTNCFFIIDIGSGLGHLSRMLNYGFNLRVCAIEAQGVLCEQARKLDNDFEKLLANYTKCVVSNDKTVHVNSRIETDVTVSDFLEIIRSAFDVKDEKFQFGIVGLHPCGDLGATLLKLYKKCDNAKFINIVGCCYMKLTTPSTETSTSMPGFPLSQFCKRNHFDLSYHSREIACHAVENYIDKLIKGESWRLKIHTYRALIEKIITHLYPDLHHSALASVKYTEDLAFKSYCKKAVSKLRIDIPENALRPEQIDLYLAQWKKVVVFYSLRLLFAPLIETIILQDRFLFLQESGSHCSILPVFNSEISPRNHVLTALKSDLSDKNT